MTSLCKLALANFQSARWALSPRIEQMKVTKTAALANFGWGKAKGGSRCETLNNIHSYVARGMQCLREYLLAETSTDKQTHHHTPPNQRHTAHGAADKTDWAATATYVLIGNVFISYVQVRVWVCRCAHTRMYASMLPLICSAFCSLLARRTWYLFDSSFLLTFVYVFSSFAA